MKFLLIFFLSVSTAIYAEEIVSPDKQFKIVTGAQDGSVILAKANSQEALLSIFAKAGAATTASWAPDSRHAVVIDNSNPDVSPTFVWATNNGQWRKDGEKGYNGKIGQFISKRDTVKTREDKVQKWQRPDYVRLKTTITTDKNKIVYLAGYKISLDKIAVDGPSASERIVQKVR